MKFYTQEQVADMLGVTKWFVRDARLRGDLAYSRLSRNTVRISEEALQDWIDRTTTTPKGTRR